MTSLIYPYHKADIFDSKINYSYAEFKGMPFVDSWRVQRESFLCKENNYHEYSAIQVISTIQSQDKNALSEGVFIKWSNELYNHILDEEIFTLLKRFEVTKKIYSDYNTDYRPIDKADFRRPHLYIMFGLVLVSAYRETSKLQFLNSLLKVDDIICSCFGSLTKQEQFAAEWLIYNEIILIEELIKK